MKNALFVFVVVFGMASSGLFGDDHAPTETKAAPEAEEVTPTDGEPGEADIYKEMEARSRRQSAPRTPEALVSDTRKPEEQKAAIEAALNAPDELDPEEEEGLKENLAKLMEDQSSKVGLEELADQVAKLEDQAKKEGASPADKASAEALLSVLRARIAKETNLDRVTNLATTKKGEVDRGAGTSGSKVLAREYRERTLELSRIEEGKKAAIARDATKKANDANNRAQAALDAVVPPDKKGENPTLSKDTETLRRASDRMYKEAGNAQVAGDTQTANRLLRMADRLADAGTLSDSGKAQLARDLASEGKTQNAARDSANKTYAAASKQTEAAASDTASRARVLRPQNDSAVTPPAPGGATKKPEASANPSSPSAFIEPAPAVPAAAAAARALTPTTTKVDGNTAYSLPNGKVAVVDGRKTADGKPLVLVKDGENGVWQVYEAGSVGLTVGQNGKLSVSERVYKTAVTDNGTTSFVPVVFNEDGTKAYTRVLDVKTGTTYRSNSDGSIVQAPIGGGAVTPVSGDLPAGVFRTTAGLEVLNKPADLSFDSFTAEDYRSFLDSAAPAIKVSAPAPRTSTTPSEALVRSATSGRYVTTGCGSPKGCRRVWVEN